MTLDAWRGLRRSPGFTATAVLTLSAGIAAITVMAALVQGVLLRPLPVRDQDRLVVAWKRLPASGFDHYPFARDEIDTLDRASTFFERAAGVSFSGNSRDFVVENGVEGELRTTLVTGNFFEVLGTPALAGRTLAASDDVDGAEPVLVITHGLWQRRYGGAPDAVGRRLTLGGRTFSIVGVMPPGLEYPRGVEAWRPLRSVPADSLFGAPARRDVDLVGRLRAGATPAQAEDELRAVMAALLPDGAGDEARERVPVLRPYETVVVGEVRPALVALSAAVALVLFIAGANLANLFLVRAESRRTELALRAALGAGRGRLAGLVVAEGACLASAAGAAGVVVASWSLPALLGLVPGGLPRADSVRLDLTVVAFSVAAAFATAALAGLGPALWTSQADPARALRGVGRGPAAPASRRRRGALVVAQAALAVPVLAAALLLGRTVRALETADMGLATGDLLLVEMAVPAVGDAARHQRFLETVTSRLEALPVVGGVTPVNAPPFSGTGGWDVPTFTAEGQRAEQASANPALNLEAVHPGYFETLGIRLRRGRSFTGADVRGAPAVAVLTEDVAARLWPGEDPVGRRIKMGGVDSPDPWRTVVGTVDRTRYRALADPPPTLYLPAEQFLVTAQRLLVRSSAPAGPVAALARDVVREVDPGATVTRVVAFSDLLDGPLARPRFTAVLILIFGAAAWLLAAVGLYAVSAADVRQRYPEIGVRLALGATAREIRAMILGGGVRLAASGALAGAALAIAAERILRGRIAGVGSLDAASIAAAAALLVGASIAACLAPARLAGRADPAALLRRDH